MMADEKIELPEEVALPTEAHSRLLTGNLTLLMALEANGLERKANELTDKIEAGLSRRPKRAAQTEEGRVNLPGEERGRGEFDLKELDRINARLARNAYITTAKSSAGEKREADLIRRQQIEAAPRLKADQNWQRDALAETLAIAEARGQQIETERSGAKRIVDHDPIRALAAYLTDDQYNTALEVRALYESRAQDAGAMEYTGMPGAAHDNDKFVWVRMKRANACEFIGRIERAVAINCSAEPVCLVTIRAICERGWPMVCMGKGRAFERNCVAFARALDVADDVLRRRI